MSEQGKSRRKITIANLPPALTTRARNKEAHPGAPDIPKPRRTTAEVTAAKAIEENIRQADQDALAVAYKDVADIEDRLRREDLENECLLATNSQDRSTSNAKQPKGTLSSVRRHR